MSDPQRLPDEQIEALVRTYLRRQADDVSAEEILARVQAARRANTGPVPRSRHRRRWLAGLGAAAALLLAFLGGLLLSPSPARATSAEALVREAKKVHALPRDRCYVVQITPEPGGPLDRFPRFRQTREHRLWTRGDRFYLESVNPEFFKWAWGRDEQGRVWVALNGKEGYRFEPGEVRENVGFLVDLLGMKAETLLDDVLRHFDLIRENAEPGAATFTVRALPRYSGAKARMRSVVLEIDAETKVLRRLELNRAVMGKPAATVTYSLIETEGKPDTAYTLEGHLPAGAPVTTGMPSDPRRARVIRTLFGIPQPPPQRPTS